MSGETVSFAGRTFHVLAPAIALAKDERLALAFIAGRAVTKQQAALKAWVLRGPDPEKDEVSAWRLVDICEHAERAYGVCYSEWGMSRLLKRLGLSRQKTRPRHPQGNAAEQAAFKKWAWVEARGDRRGASGRAAGAVVPG